MLRPTTTIEQESHVYIFPDVEYIQRTTRYEQGETFDADPAEFEVWKARVAVIAEKVRSEDDEGKEEQAGDTAGETGSEN